MNSVKFYYKNSTSSDFSYRAMAKVDHAGITHPRARRAALPGMGAVTMQKPYRFDVTVVNLPFFPVSFTHPSLRLTTPTSLCASLH
jgi:hypothetical protein